MLLEKLLGPRVKTKVSRNKEQLSPKETLLKEIDDQILLIIGKNPPKKYMKKSGRICKHKDGTPKMRPIKSWFSDENQFKPTPLGITFLQGDRNCYDIGHYDKLEILNNFKDEVSRGSYRDDLSKWNELCEKRNSIIKKSKKIVIIEKINDR
ncbi:MAG: hypothetical protein P8K09_05545 [Hyphomicrobiales bacterium]|nr:hypothetical protein [Hyphomicrobiales bacterium]